MDKLNAKTAGGKMIQIPYPPESIFHSNRELILDKATSEKLMKTLEHLDFSKIKPLSILPISDINSEDVIINIEFTKGEITQWISYTISNYKRKVLII